MAIEGNGPLCGSARYSNRRFYSVLDEMFWTRSSSSGNPSLSCFGGDVLARWIVEVSFAIAM